MRTIQDTPHAQLWFDVEKRYKTINYRNVSGMAQLWFDVEKRFKTIMGKPPRALTGCGLM